MEKKTEAKGLKVKKVLTTKNLKLVSGGLAKKWYDGSCC